MAKGDTHDEFGRKKIRFSEGSGRTKTGRESALDKFNLATLNKEFTPPRVSALEKWKKAQEEAKAAKPKPDNIQKLADDLDVRVMNALMDAQPTKLEPVLAVPANKPLIPERRLWPQMDGSPPVQRNLGGGDVSDYRLQVKNSTSGGTIQVSVNYGEVGGFSADATLDVNNNPPTSFAIPNQGVNYIYVKVPIAYVSCGLWEISQPSILVSTGAQTNSSTFFYIELTRVTRSGSELTLPAVPATRGDVWLGRWGPSGGNYIDAFGHVAT